MGGWLLPAALVASSAISTLGKKKIKPQTVEQGPMYTPEQQEALKRMLGFAMTGTHGKYTAGEGYKGPLGSYEMTDLEKSGQSALADLMGKTIGTQGFGTGMGFEQLGKLFSGEKFDPYSEKGVYSGFKKQTQRELQEAQDRLHRGMAVTGDLYSTATAKESGLLQERGQDILTNKLAELYQDYSNKQIGAIPWALSAEQAAKEGGMREQALGEDIAMGRIGASQQYGATQRLLEDARLKGLYSEWSRAHEESKEPLRALESIYGSSPNWGSKSMTAPGYTAESPWAQVLNNALKLGTSYFMSGNHYIPYGSKLNLLYGGK